MRVAVMICALALAGCSDEPSEAEREAAVAEVEAHQEPPVEELEPAQFTAADIERGDLYGAGCIFKRPSDGEYGIAIARAGEGYLKRNGDVDILAADMGSAELPYLARRKYDGRVYSFTIDLDAEAGVQSGEETSDYPAMLSVRDGQDRIVFETRGTAQCGA